MKKILIGTIILCILHSILLVNQSLGINVVLFTVPLLIFLILMMEQEKVIRIIICNTNSVVINNILYL